MKLLGVSGVYDYAGPRRNLRYRSHPCCLPPMQKRRRPDCIFSELNTQPTCTPVYASPNTSRCATQNSGPSGSLLLSRRTLAFPASCRFIPAHCIGDLHHSLSHIFFDVRDRFIWKLKLRARCCCQRLQVSQENMKSEMAAKCLTRRRSDPSDRDSRSDLQTQVTLRSSQRRARPAMANQDSTHSTRSNPVSMVTLVPVTLPCR
jgi:hypothetical protein